MLCLVIPICGCRIPTAYNRQPPLHHPVIRDYQKVVITTNDAYSIFEKTYVETIPLPTNHPSTTGAFSETTTRTNVYKYLVLVKGTNLVEFPPAIDIEFITNGDRIYPLAYDVIDIKNEYEDIPGGTIKAFFQIESDADAREEFGTDFSSCFYVGQVDIYNADTNKTFLADAASLRVMTSFYLTEKDWASSLTLQENMRRRYGGEYIRMPRHPLIYSDILAIFEFQQKSDPRQTFSDYLDSAGTIASGVSLFVPGALFGKGVNFAVGIVKPEIQKRLLWDLLQHHANFAARGLPEIIRVPPNGAVNGLVFFPKRGIPGYVDGNEVFISSFNSKQTALITGALISNDMEAKSATLPTITQATNAAPLAVPPSQNSAGQNK